MSTNTALDDIGARIRACKPCDFGLRHANKLAHEDAPKLLAALEAVEAKLTRWEAEATGKSSQDYTLRAVVTMTRSVIEEALR